MMTPTTSTEDPFALEMLESKVDLYQRWDRNSFVARMNRSKREGLQVTEQRQ